MRFRRAKESDLDRLVDIHMSAYPDPRGVEARRRKLVANPLGGLDDLRVVEREGIVVGHAFLFALEMGFGGARVRAGGIATVGVAPEARGEGVAGALLAELHEESRARGDAVCVLYPFRAGFYARHGYGPTGAARRLRFHPRAVPDAWHASSVAVRAAGGDDLGAIMGVYDRALLRGTGMLARPRRLWEQRVLDERRRWFVAVRGGRVTGYLAWMASQTEQHAETRLTVYDLLADDDETRRALFGLLGAQRDQVDEVELEVAEGDPIDRALEDADRARPGTEVVEHAVGEVVAGPMVRVVDVPRALEMRGYRGDGTLELTVDGAGAYRLEVHGRRGRAVPATGAPALRFRGMPQLASVLYGALAPSAAARLGWVEAPVPESLEVADALLALPPYFALDPF